MAAVHLAVAPSPSNTDAPSSRPLSLSIAAALQVQGDSPSAAASPASSAASPSCFPTPSSSTSTTAPPIAIRPDTASRSNSSMTMSALSPAGTPAPKPMTMTSKEWVVPPRPKPGRKPATDTPPTKRKAQNRAAQRAFRERRAARVGELEEQLDEQREDHERVVRELQERIGHLELETQTLQSRCQWLEGMLEKEKQRNSGLEHQQFGGNQPSLVAQAQSQSPPAVAPRPKRPLQPAPPKAAGNPIASLPGQASIVEPRPMTMTQPLSISHIISPPEEGTPTFDLTCGGCQPGSACPCAEEALRNVDQVPVGCGNCTLGSDCQCFEQALQATFGMSELKRPLPPGSPSPLAPEEKRQRSDEGTIMEMETDFTAMFSSNKEKGPMDSVALKPMPMQVQPQPLISIEPRESCGFCKDGTYCVCADMLASASMPAPTMQHTPPPSDDDVVPLAMEVTATGAIKLPGFQSLHQNRPVNATQSRSPAKTGRCGPNGPGTCAQCLSDPKSGLFCRSLAANFEKNNPGSGGGCCGGGGPGGCCKEQGDADAAPATSVMSLGVSLSCADAYKTLASHQNFDEAADDIGSWLPKLKALPIPRPRVGAAAGGPGHGAPGRAPIEVEAASIMSVLKDFDVRFGRGQ